VVIQVFITLVALLVGEVVMAIQETLEAVALAVAVADEQGLLQVFLDKEMLVQTVQITGLHSS
jgi:hypothetical protein